MTSIPCTIAPAPGSVDDQIAAAEAEAKQRLQIVILPMTSKCKLTMQRAIIGVLGTSMVVVGGGGWCWLWLVVVGVEGVVVHCRWMALRGAN
jgi:hypothetical protein